MPHIRASDRFAAFMVQLLLGVAPHTQGEMRSEGGEDRIKESVSSADRDYSGCRPEGEASAFNETTE